MSKKEEEVTEREKKGCDFPFTPEETREFTRVRNSQTSSVKLKERKACDFFTSAGPSLGFQAKNSSHSYSSF